MVILSCTVYDIVILNNIHGIILSNIFIRVIYDIINFSHVVFDTKLVKQIFPTEDLKCHIISLCEHGRSVNVTLKVSGVVSMTKV